MSSANSNPPIFPEAEKFDGTNFGTFETLITIAASSRGVLGYLQGTITNPAPYPNPTTLNYTPTLPNVPLPDDPTPWYSTTPSGAEWAMRDAWARALLLYNTKNAVGLGLKLDGTAAEAWNSLTSQYKVSSDLAMITAQRDLRNITFTDGNDFPTHISNLRTKWVTANNAGAKINDADFRMVILSSLPASWDSVVGTLYEAKSSADVISRLTIHWNRIDRSKSVANPATTVTALQADTRKPRSQLLCANQNCGRRGHTIANCYWRGGGKEGQFPPGFGQRGGARGSTPNNATPNTSSVTAALTDATPTSEITLALVSDMGHRNYLLTEDVKVVSTVGDEVVDIHAPGEDLLASRDCVLDSYPHGAWGCTHALAATTNRGEHNVPTYADSAANKHCFVNRSDFSTYHALSQPDEGQSANKGGQFRIVGHGAVTKTIISGSLRTTLTFKHAVHTPDLIANLVSISKLDEANCWTLFGGGGVTFYDMHEGQKRTLMKGTGNNGMYLLNVEPLTHALTACSLNKPTSLDTWHRRLGHAGVHSITDMARRGLVDGLNVLGDVKLDGKCEDCIYGKQTARPYDGAVEPETEVLEWVYGDLWGPARVRSVGGAVYMFVLNDGGSSYRVGYFLTSKSGDATLDAFSEYHTRSERETGKKLIRLRVDMGSEFFNEKWREYTTRHGIIVEFSAPYAHGQNGVAERGMRIIIKGVRCVLADSGLPPSLWADAAAYIIYTRNLIPSARHPRLIPAEKWTNKRQDISHLRPFGCIAYAKIPAEISISKLAPRSIKYALIGYFGRGTYKLWDRASGTTIKSRDVIFEEGHGHRTIPDDGDMPPLVIIDDEDDFDDDTPPTTTSSVDSTDPGAVVVPRKPLAPRPRPTDPPLHPNATTPTVPAEATPTPTPLPDAPTPTVPRRSARLADLGTGAPTDTTALHTTLPDSQVPRSYWEAITRPELWKPAMDTEWGVLRERGVFELVDAPPEAHIIDSMWVFTNKYDANGNIIRRKARLVAKGYTQIPGLDYDQTYASVVRLESFRIVAAIAASLDLHIWQVDIVAAFLYSTNKFTTYMRQPPGFVVPGEERKVLRVVKTLYGMMQGGYDFQVEMSGAYESLGYYKSLADPCVHSRTIEGVQTITSTYTDDIFGASSTKEGAERAKKEIEACFEIKDVGDLGYILGIHFEKDENTGAISLSQEAYIRRILERFGMLHCNAKPTPLPSGITLSESDCPKTDEDRHYMKDKPYREALGSCMWAQVATRPDIAYALSVLARFQGNPGPAHWKAMLHLLAYLKGTIGYKITYNRGGSLDPIGFVDADYAGDVDTRRSTSGYVFTIAGGPVSWSAKRQATVALSTTEAEYMALTHAAQQALWMYSFMSEIGLARKFPAILHGDNAASIALTLNTKGHARAKHIDIRHHYIRERVAEGEIGLVQIPSEENLADIFTKPLPRITHQKLVRALKLDS
ncbi:retrovirus-related pol polyprotein [Laccaria bicolor S238N-H82]|uniref:Retrovirus-related pol polyprotein n=1 Tax=Laccaria bicolor (strain S238N-H82 / ATCC MYA-4686) TaxID=486041 RepID=B0DF37_LACBS|nr:retrovirus-related pol polyprotein [Laccaria bicolor S238N-H82]EDR06651.1 retrovirus-related pol polyprotein [Laccaria bicolor S238N-H82]|eukprot:XP_001882498.1 retrovirus-related pol polyprotein [Laccaria bicolor S238N-H82]